MKKLLCVLSSLLLLLCVSCSSPQSSALPAPAASNPISSSSASSTFDPRDVEQTSTPDSSCFSAVGYDSKHQTLVVTFRDSGVSYAYSDVPHSVWSELLDAPSMGSFYNSEIKGQYPSERLD